MTDKAQDDDQAKRAPASPAKDDDAAATETSGAGYGNNAYTDAGTGAPSDSDGGE